MMSPVKSVFPRLAYFLFACVYPASVAAEAFDVWDFDPHGMAVFIWSQNGDPPLTQQHQTILQNSIEKDFALAGKYYPTPVQIADFYLKWYASGYPDDKGKLRTSIIDWESIVVTKSDMDRAMTAERVDFVRRNQTVLEQRGLIRQCQNNNMDPSCFETVTYDGEKIAYRILNTKGFEKKLRDQWFDYNQKLKMLKSRIRARHFSRAYPNKENPSDLTNEMRDAHIRPYWQDRDQTYAGAIMENVINDIDSKQ